MNKLTKIFLFMCLSVFVSNVIAEIDVIKTAQQLNPILYMQMKGYSEEEKLGKLAKIEKGIRGELVQNPNRPELYWLLGLHAWAKLYAWDNPVPLEKNRAQKESAGEDFRKALELDNPDNPNLSVDMLYSIKKFAPSDVHVEAGRRILEVEKNIEPRMEVELRGGMIQHLLRLERYSDVMKQIGIIEKKYPDSEYAQGAREYYSKVIEKAKQGKNQSKNKNVEQTESAGRSKSDSKSGSPSDDPSQSTSDQAKDPVLSSESNFTRQVIIIAFVLIGLAVVLYIVLRSRKK